MILYGWFSESTHDITLAHQRCVLIDNPTRAQGTQTSRRQPAEAQQPVVDLSLPLPKRTQGHHSEACPTSSATGTLSIIVFTVGGKVQAVEATLATVPA